jgi:hypothetical protein
MPLEHLLMEGAMTKYQDVWEEIKENKSRVGWPEEDQNTTVWWEEFEKMNSSRPELILRVLSELEKRSRTIYEFFYAYVYSKKDTIQGSLDFLDATARQHPDLKQIDKEVFADQMH